MPTFIRYKHPPTPVLLKETPQNIIAPSLPPYKEARHTVNYQLGGALQL